jgi:hypothetical protein
LVEGLSERRDGVVVVDSGFALICKLLQIKNLFVVSNISPFNKHIGSPHGFCRSSSTVEKSLHAELTGLRISGGRTRDLARVDDHPLQSLDAVRAEPDGAALLIVR